jgi:hypothetical protein
MSQQIQITGGAKVRDLQDVIIGTSGVLSSVAFNVANGVPKLDVNGKILVSQLPNSVMEYKGVWNAATNSPTLTNGGAFNEGDVYLCNVAGTVNFGSGAPITFAVGDSAIYSSVAEGSVWQKSGGATGTVTSVGLSTNAGAITIGNSPISTSGVISANFNGTNLQYVNGAGNLTTFPTLITSIGLTMPSAFSVANSPLTANGTIAVTGAGFASQYIRGDGTLADFPSSGGGGSSVSYYLNGGTSQGTIGGTTYYEMSKTADTGTGVDFTKTGDGFIVAFLTDANDPAQLNIPAGNWNYEIYASMSANGGTPQMYAELYVYNGTTFTLISTSSNEILYDGTNLNLYSFAMTVPATTLTLTDRLAIKLYATNSGGKTTTIHTQDGHLCQVITTFSTGITALNGLTAQVQYFQTGTSGTDFNISSTTATHTFNIPDASATARGLITTGTQTIAGTKTFSDATKNNGGIFLQNASSSSLAGYMNLGGLTNGVKFTSGGGISNSFTLPSATGYTFTFPNATGTLALTSDISYPVTSVFGRTGAVVATSGDYTTAQVTESGNLYFTEARARNSIYGVAPLVYNSVGGQMSIDKADGFLSGYLSATDWTTFNNKQAALNGTGFVKISGTTISYDNSTYYLASNPSAFIALTALSAGVGISYNNTTGVITNSAPDQVVALTASTGISVTGTYPNFTITNTSPSSGGTVTSVAALTIGTSGTDVSSTVATSTTTPVITLNIPSASATNRGLVTTGTQTFAGVKTFNDNIGIAASPSAWNSVFNTIQIQSQSALSANSSSLLLSRNFYVNSSGTSKYIQTGYANLYEQSVGEHIWYNAPLFSGGLDDLTFTNVLRIANTGIVTIYNLAGTGNRMVIASSTGVLSTQAIPTGTVTTSGSPTTNYLPKFTGASTIGNSLTEDNGTVIGINGAVATHIFQIYSGGTNYARVGITNTSTGNTASDGLIFQQETINSIIKNQENGFLAFGVNGAETNLVIAQGGNVLINTATDSGYKLDVNGTGRFSSTLNVFNGNIIVRNDTGSTYRGLSIGATTADASEYAYMKYQPNVGELKIWGSPASFGGKTTFWNNDIQWLNVSSANALTFTGAATFSGNVSLSKSSNSGSGASFPRFEVENTLATQGDGSSTFNFADIRIASGNSTVQMFLATTYAAGTWAPAAIINVSSNHDLQIKTNNTTRLTIASGGGATFTGSVTATSFFESSDSRLKTLIQDNYQTKGIASITPKLYTKNGKVELGYYAQDFVGILDSAVSKGSDDMLSLSYREVHTAKIYALEQEIKELKAKMN